MRSFIVSAFVVAIAATPMEMQNLYERDASPQSWGSPTQTIITIYGTPPAAAATGFPNNLQPQGLPSAAPWGNGGNAPSATPWGNGGNAPQPTPNYATWQNGQGGQNNGGWTNTPAATSSQPWWAGPSSSATGWGRQSPGGNGNGWGPAGSWR